MYFYFYAGNRMSSVAMNFIIVFFFTFLQSPELEGNVEGNVEQFVVQPANKKMHYKCRITRDRKGMDRGLYPTYFLHLERDYGKKVIVFCSLSSLEYPLNKFLFNS